MLTPERVSLRYDVAGVGSRGAAILVDGLVQLLLVIVLTLLLAGAAAVFGRFDVNLGDALAIIMVAVVVAAYFALIWGYFIFFEITWSGQTPGKRMLGLRVIRENGYPVRATDVVIRNVVRIVDQLPTGYAIGIISMLFNERSKRLGDFAAGTLVIREGAARELVSATLGSLTTEHNLAHLRPEDATLIRDFLLRRPTMGAEARRALANRLAGVMAERYGLAAERATAMDEAFLERLVAGVDAA